MVRPTSTRFPDELIEEKFRNVEKGFEDLHTVVHERYNATDKKLEDSAKALDDKLEENKLLILAKLSAIEVQTVYTNGKVRKIIIALVMLFGIMIGTGFEPARLMLPLLIG